MDANVRVYWEDVKGEVNAVNPELYQIIESLNVTTNYPLYRVRYPFGSIMVDQGVTHYPSNKGKSVPLASLDNESHIQQDLGYAPVPLGLLLNRGSEVFVTAGSKRIVPLRLLTPGQWFGLAEILDLLCGNTPRPFWSLSAGARSIFMLPKITEMAGYKRLRREYSIPSALPRDLSDHWRIFKAITHSHETAWTCDVLYFTKPWLIQQDEDPKWYRFHNFLFQKKWTQIRKAQERLPFSLLWQSFTDAISQRNMRPRPYLADTVKHLIGVAAGFIPAFRPANDLELIAPTKLIQDIYVSTYGLKYYLPTIMHPGTLNQCQKDCHVYYSLAFPTLLEGSVYSSNLRAIIADLRDVKTLVEMMTKSLTKSESGPQHNLIRDITYDFFHAESDDYSEIKSNAALINNDFNLTADASRFKDRTFCLTAPFLRGCIRISTGLTENHQG